MVSDVVQLSVSQQTDLLLIFGAKGLILFYFVHTGIFKAYIFSLSPLKNCANKAWLLILHDYVIIAPEEIETVGTW